MQLNKWMLILLGLVWMVIGVIPPITSEVYQSGLILLGLGICLEKKD